MRRLLFSGDQSTHSIAASWGLLFLRVGAGLTMMLSHGWGKLSTFETLSARFADPYGFGPTLSLGLTVFAEFFCSLLLIAGLFTRWATIPLIIAMLTAFFVIHGADPFPRKELALMFAVPFITLLIAGPGRFSLDRLFMRSSDPIAARTY